MAPSSGSFRVRRLDGTASDYDSVLERIGDARIVCLGEATHGTHEFYRERAEITKRLVVDHGLAAVAAEADWPDAYRVNRYVRGVARDRNALEALGSFRRFPLWMWRNREVVEFVEWLREWNDSIGDERRKVGFYGLDLYSLFTSIAHVIVYLEKRDPAAAKRARSRYACFEHFGEDPQRYGYAAASGMAESCEDEVVSQLVEMRERAFHLIRRDGLVARDEWFSAEQNARVAKNAEGYYRSMFRGRVSSWNLRDRHMADTLEALVAHLGAERLGAKIAVWEHNSHLGDARATEMGEHGELNVGQLVRERYDGESALVGFTTYTGTVAAASQWDSPVEMKRVRPALPGSYEALFHDAGAPRFAVDLRERDVAERLRGPRLERAIGVIYLPETERRSHYFHCRLPEQFDVVLHFDETRAVEPLDRTVGFGERDLPETYPSAV